MPQTGKIRPPESQNRPIQARKRHKLFTSSKLQLGSSSGLVAQRFPIITQENIPLGGYLDQYLVDF
jgi:hypothetical protein